MARIPLGSELWRVGSGKCLRAPRLVPRISSMTTRRVANGEAIKALREALGWRTSRFAKAAGISSPYLSNIEGGVRHGSPEALTRIAATLGVPLAAITRDAPDLRRRTVVRVSPVEQVAA